MSWGANGQWVRARNEEGMKAFMAEKESEQQQLRDHAVRRDAAFRKIVAWVRKRFRRGK